MGCQQRRGMLAPMRHRSISHRFLSRATLGVLASSLAALALAALPRTTDLNLANQAELEMVKGIGPQLSERILTERAQGRFDSWENFIGRMKGIGPSHATRLSAAGLRVAGQPYAIDQAGSGAAASTPAK
jgi:competence protein ComEA